MQAGIALVKRRLVSASPTDATRKQAMNQIAAPKASYRSCRAFNRTCLNRVCCGAYLCLVPTLAGNASSCHACHCLEHWQAGEPLWGASAPVGTIHTHTHAVRCDANRKTDRVIKPVCNYLQHLCWSCIKPYRHLPEPNCGHGT